MLLDSSEVDAAIRAFNRASIAEFSAATGTRWLGIDGPVYRLSAIRVRALFTGNADGRPWGDAALVAESISGNRCPELDEDCHAAMCAPGVECRDLDIYSDMRGRWNGLVAPLDEISSQLHLAPAVHMPDTTWARNWWTIPHRTDDQEMAWAAHGGTPLGVNPWQL